MQVGAPLSIIARWDITFGLSLRTGITFVLLLGPPKGPKSFFTFGLSLRTGFGSVPYKTKGER